jgi:hypothetical protein
MFLTIEGCHVLSMWPGLQAVEEGSRLWKSAGSLSARMLMYILPITYQSEHHLRRTLRVAGGGGRDQVVQAATSV